jgi:hypothetical protein
MMRTLAILLAAGVSMLFAADNPWDKVKELKSGTEIRIVRKGVAQPLEAKFDEATDDHIVIVVKKEQRSIAKDEIDRLDYRPNAGGRTTESKVTNTPADTTPTAGMSHGPNVPGQSSSSTVSFNKPAYETLYRRVAHSMFTEPKK